MQKNIFTQEFIKKNLNIRINQQHPPDPEQSQVGSVPRNIPLIIPAAQPTPDFTVTAPAAQFMAQAPHSIQKSLYGMNAFFSFIIKTSCGQTVVQTAQPLHFSLSNCRVTTSFKYVNPFIIF